MLREEARRFHRNVPGDLSEKDFSWLVSKLIDPETGLTSSEHRDAVNRLRQIRNTKIGHPRKVSVSDREFNNLVSEVEECFKILTNNKRFIQELQEIKDGKAI